MMHVKNRPDAGLGPVAVAIGLAALLGTGCSDDTVDPDATSPTSARTNVEADLAPMDDPAAGEADRPDPAAAGVPWSFEPPGLDLGILRPEETVEIAFAVHNTGDEPLRIGRVRPTCACTKLEPLTTDVIAPGASVDIRGTLSGRRSGGTRETTITFIFDGAPSPVDYRLRAEYARAVRTTPGYLALLRGLSGTLEVEALDQRPFRILAVHGRTPEYVSYQPGDPPRTAYTLRYDFSGYDPATCMNDEGERMPAWLCIETDHPGAPLLDVATRHRCTVPEPPKPGGRTWYLDPATVNLGAILPGEPVEIDVDAKWLPRSTDRTARIYTALPNSAGLTSRLLDATPTPEGFHLRIEVTPEPGRVGLLDGSVMIHSESASTPLTVLASVRQDVVPPSRGAE